MTTRSTSDKRKIDNWISSKFKTCVLQNDSIKKVKETKPHNGRKYLQVIVLIKDLLSEFIKNKNKLLQLNGKKANNPI